MKSILLYGLLLCFAGQLFSQSIENVPFTFATQKAVKIDAKRQKLLQDKTWTTFKIYRLTNGTAALHAGDYVAFKFSAGGQFNGTVGPRSVRGTWQRPDKRTLHIAAEAQDETAQTTPIGGTYAIYKLTADELVFEKKSPDTNGQRLVYYLKSSKNSVLTERPTAVVNPATATPVDKKALEATRQERERATLLHEIDTEVQLRGIELKEKPEKLDLKTLQILKKRILSGEYQKPMMKG